jgi:hypothetical protein
MTFRSMMKKLALSLALVAMPFGAILVAPTVASAAAPLYFFNVVCNFGSGGWCTFRTPGSPWANVYDQTQVTYSGLLNQQHTVIYQTNAGPRSVGVWPGCTVTFILDSNGNALADVQ